MYLGVVDANISAFILFFLFSYLNLFLNGI